MNGLYLHIPFCKSKCHYCDFYSVVKGVDAEMFTGLVQQETELRRTYLPDTRIDTVYLGGGTPSLLPASSIAGILETFDHFFALQDDTEITLEVNPDDVSTAYVREVKAAGINRISMGLQSFEDPQLVLMNRRHNAIEGIKAVETVYSNGIEKISIDLIYGLPGLTLDQWRDTLARAVKLPADHISAYHLGIEPGTRFSTWKKKGVIREMPEEQSWEQYEWLNRVMNEEGFRHYEISNFARKGALSRHNVKYWNGTPYLGLGPSAHSFNGFQRHWNPRSLVKWSESVRAGTLPEGEDLTPEMVLNEYLMTRLRTDEGINLAEFTERFGEEESVILMKNSQRYRESGDLYIREGFMLMTEPAWFRSDSILSDLFRI